MINFIQSIRMLISLKTTPFGQRVERVIQVSIETKMETEGMEAQVVMTQVIIEVIRITHRVLSYSRIVKKCYRKIEVAGSNNTLARLKPATAR
jgi:hypothetical protein